MGAGAVRTHKGVWYWASRKGAEGYQAAHPEWTRIVAYERGYALQAGPSGNYAGPGVPAKTWDVRL